MGSGQSLQALVTALERVVIDPLLLFFFALSLVVFVWGIVEYLWKLSRGENSQEGRRHMFYGIAGMFIMVSAYSIFLLIQGTVNQLLQ